MPSPWKRVLLRAAIAALSVLVPLAAVEGYYRVTKRPRPQGPPATVFCGDCPEIFELNARYPSVSPQKLRDRVYEPKAAPGVFRILIVGDSIPFGPHVQPADTFPKVMERALEKSPGHVEVINAGVTAYSPYNERQMYVHRLRDLHPDLVVVSFCVNDVVDPLLHWMSFVTGQLPFDTIPAEAIPNPEYHASQALPKARKELEEKRARVTALLPKLELYQHLVAPILAPGMPDTHVTAGGKTFPAFITGEDTISMEVLADWDSPEWVWLRGQYDKLFDEIEKDGPPVVLLINPIEYQLPPDYPLSPQRLLERYCKERGIRCLDVLPALREHADGPRLFSGKLGHLIDMWHYSPAGHEVVADALGEYLKREGLLPAR